MAEHGSRRSVFVHVNYVLERLTIAVEEPIKVEVLLVGQTWAGHR
jgi:hypothetical protein